jgi:predicted Zn finger-like uncharacterized protein
LQTSCAQCSQKIVVDDAKVPDRPFLVKCPKCGGTIRMPGRAPVAPTVPPAELETQDLPEAAGAASPAEVLLPPGPAPTDLRGEATAEGPSGRALVALPDRTQAAALEGALAQAGFGVDTADELEDPARLLDEGLYSLVATNRAVAQAGGAETLYQRVGRQNTDARRQFFLVLCGAEFKTGSAVQAFAVLADLVLNPADLARCSGLVKGTMAERRRLYQPLRDAQLRLGRDET